MVILEFNQINTLKKVIIPFFSKNNNKYRILQTKKYKDFWDWSIIVDIYYHGYHIISQGISLINDIKKGMNNFRLNTNNSSVNLVKLEDKGSLNSRLSCLFLLPSPYVIKDGVRYLRGTNNLISEGLTIAVFDDNKVKLCYTSISECSKSLGIGRLIIINCILTGKI